MKTLPKDSAFASHAAFEESNPNYNDARNRISGGGLSKREYFAAIALPGVYAQYPNASAAKYAVEIADLLIEELNKGKGI